MPDIGAGIDGQADGEGRAPFRRAVDDDAPAMAFGDVTDVRQPQAPAFDLDVLDPLEGVEQPLHLGRWNRRSRVVNGKHHAGIDTADAHRDRLRRVAVFAGVGHQVLEEAPRERSAVRG